MTEFQPFPKIARLNREVIVTEKIDGTNGCVVIEEDGTLLAQSRSRIISPDDDNFGFANWVSDNRKALIDTLGPGRHYGEWWGAGIQRGYGLPKGERRFSLFNVRRWEDVLSDQPNAIGLAHTPILYKGPFAYFDEGWLRTRLDGEGSLAAPGFMRPEGFVLYHVAANTLFKVTLEKDDEPKGRAA